ncbi:MAG: membrane protein insertase YidC [Alphaproteobacteria bacterium]|nr:membrane protein insertase YidC [Alphaproteobacteria bacterium]
MHSEDTRNLVIAIAIIIAMYLGYQIFLVGHVKPQPDLRTKQNIESSEEAAKPQGSVQGAAVPTPMEAASTVEARGTVLQRSPRIAVRAPRLRGSLRVEGGRLDDLTLVGYRQTVDKDSPDVVLLSPNGTEEPYYVDFGWQPSRGSTIPVPGADTPWQTDSKVLAPDQPVTLTWDNGQGLIFTRTYSIDRNYMITVVDTVKNTGTAAVSLAPQSSINRIGVPETKHSAIIHEGMVGVFGKSLEHVSYKDMKKKWADQQSTADAGKPVVTHQSTGGWLGITDKYWLVAVAPKQDELFYGGFDYSRSNGRDVYRSTYAGPIETVEPGGTVRTEKHLFAGAKETKLIDSYEDEYGIVNFDRAIDWGWFYFLARPVFWLLEHIKALVGNFGLAILAITVLFKLAFFTLANKSYVAMGKMRKLTPKLTALRERYKDDPVKQREEMMKLYQTEKVNPISGCLPMLVQIPVFIALYQVLMVSIEMRHAPFYGWVKDLSGPDPLLVTNLFGLIPWHPPGFLAIGLWSLIMGVTMYVQQQLNPPPPDPVQAKVFRFLPLVFVFLFATFPVGLVIYWTWNNLLTICQQWVIMKRHGAFSQT